MITREFIDLFNSKNTDVIECNVSIWNTTIDSIYRVNGEVYLSIEGDIPISIKDLQLNIARRLLKVLKQSR